MKIKIGQVYRSRRSPQLVEIVRKKGGKWQARVLTDKHKVYNGTHTLAELTLEKDFILYDE
jgi:hypothetical protein